jgi:hypothetical protein
LALALTLPFAGPTRAAEHEAHAEHFKKCAKVCADCRLECDSCFKHCVTMVAGGKKEHAATVQLCADCAAVCQLCSTLCARSSPLAAHSLEACAKSCEQCGAACAKFPDDEHMARCAKVCRDCAKECREMVKHLGGQAAK